MKHPILYDKRATNFFNLGRGVLKDTIRCIVTEERNGVFELEMTYPNEGVLADLLEVDYIIKADAGHASFSKDQLFRIERIDKSMDGLIKVYAKHVSYLAQSLALEPDIRITNASASEALATWRNSIIGSHSFITNSNLSQRHSTHLTIQNCQNARQALGGASGSILEVWGGEYRFDNYRIDLLDERGGRANTLISYGRNLTDLDQEENISNTYTSVYPYAVFRNNNDEEEIITIPGFVIDAESAGSFAHRRVLPVDFSREFEQGVRPTIAGLRTLTETFIEENEIGVPRVSIALSFVDLTKSLNQAGIAYEQVNLCDTVPVYFEKLGIRAHAKVVRIEWNVLLDQYEKLEIGVTKKTLGDTIREIERDINNANNNSNEALTSANGRNTVFFGTNEPTANRVGDLWYRPNGEHTELWMWNEAAWEFIMSTAPDGRILDQIEELGRESEGAWQESQRALEKAQKAFDVAEPLVQRTNELTEEATSVRLLAQGLQTTVTNNYTSTQSQITQLSTDINFRVKSDEIINQINISTEGVLIAGSRIRITGQTLIDNTIIRDAHIADLNAEKITTGILNAANVNIINMNANNITTGTLQGVRVLTQNGGNSTEMFDGTVRVNWSGVGNIGYANFSPEGLIFRPTAWTSQGDTGASISNTVAANTFNTAYRPDGIYWRNNPTGNFTHYINIRRTANANSAIRFFGNAAFLSPVEFNRQTLTAVGQIQIPTAGNDSGIRFNSQGNTNHQFRIFEANANLVAQSGWLHLAQGTTGAPRKYMSFKPPNQVGVFPASLGRGEVWFWANRADQGNWHTHNAIVISGQLVGLNNNGQGSWNWLQLGCSATGSVEALTTASSNSNVTTVRRPFVGSAFNVSSERKIKEDIRNMEDTGIDALAKIKRTIMYDYKLRSEVEAGIEHNHFGLLTDACPPEILSIEGDTIELYSMLTFAWQAIKQLATKVEHLEQQLDRTNGVKI